MNKPFAQHHNRIVTIKGLLSALASLIAWMGLVALALAAPGVVESSEYAVKAAFLFKFGAYVEWPPGTFDTPKTPLVIGIVGDDPFDGTLDSIVTGHAIEGRPV
ncbi:MAG: YfiR family protein, partial [Burkholderiaceae bacterium]